MRTLNTKFFFYTNPYGSNFLEDVNKKKKVISCKTV